jgi:hypothetical protein
VTTVDVYIRRADGSGAFSLHNGLFGAATTVLHALIKEFRDGTISGPWHSSYIDTTVKGTIVRSILADVGELIRPAMAPSRRLGQIRGVPGSHRRRYRLHSEGHRGIARQLQGR